MIFIKFIVILCFIVGAFAIQIQVDTLSYTEKEACRVTDLAEANRRFAYDIFHHVATANPSSNIFISPLVISMGLSMVMKGAAGRSMQELERVLRYNSEALNGYDDVHCIYNKYNSDATPTLKTATRLFGERTENFMRQFLIDTSYFGAKLDLVDFISSPGLAETEANEWVSQQTENRITQLFPEGTFNSQTKLALASVLYFKGGWEHAFGFNYTGDFRLPDLSITDVEYMYETIEAKFIFDSLSQLYFVRLPYHGTVGGPKVSMILVQDMGNIDYLEVERRLTYDTVDRAITNLMAEEEHTVDITLPMFETSQEYDLETHLQNMGLQTLFAPGLADLSAMNGRHDLYVGSAKHKTFLSVDKEGTEAAGALGLSIIGLSLPFGLTFDRPFHFLLFEESTNNIMFMGRIVDPTQG